MSSVTHDQVLGFLQAQRIGVVASIAPAGGPQSAVVGIAVTDMMEIVFDTLGTTRECENLRRLPKVSVVTGWDQEWPNSPWMTCVGRDRSTFGRHGSHFRQLSDHYCSCAHAGRVWRGRDFPVQIVRGVDECAVPPGTACRLRAA
jgi:Pyridoxamine 5'-phosphate oxidase